MDNIEWNLYIKKINIKIDYIQNWNISKDSSIDEIKALETLFPLYNNLGEKTLELKADNDDVFLARVLKLHSWFGENSFNEYIIEIYSSSPYVIDYVNDKEKEIIEKIVDLTEKIKNYKKRNINIED